MSYLLTLRTANGKTTYPAIGDLGRLIDAAYNAGALGITVIAIKVRK